jgi:DNA/RNA-binding domain of Phe-tRNA-synthetase-like protein
MDFIVADDCLRLGLRAGAVLFRNLQVAQASAGLRAEIAAETAAIVRRYPDPAQIRSLPEVVHFQNILRKVGVNPRKEQPSVERLLALAHKRGDLPAINNLVDAYNLASVRSLSSMGAHDLDRIALPVSLRLLTGAESFTPLGRTSTVPVVRGEFGYVDAQDRLLCRLDLLQADFSKVTHATRNALLIIEGTAEHPAQALDRAFTTAVDLITSHCGGTAELLRLDKLRQPTTYQEPTA